MAGEWMTGLLAAVSPKLVVSGVAIAMAGGVGLVTSRRERTRLEISATPWRRPRDRSAGLQFDVAESSEFALKIANVGTRPANIVRADFFLNDGGRRFRTGTKSFANEPVTIAGGESWTLPLDGCRVVADEETAQHSTRMRVEIATDDGRRFGRMLPVVISE